jgi:hypothetical protein
MESSAMQSLSPRAESIKSLLIGHQELAFGCERFAIDGTLL